MTSTIRMPINSIFILLQILSFFILTKTMTNHQLHSSCTCNVDTIKTGPFAVKLQGPPQWMLLFKRRCFSDMYYNMAHEYYHMRQQNSRTDEHITFSSAPFTGSPLCHPSVWLFQPDFLGSPSGQEAGLVSCFQSSGTFLLPVWKTFLTEYPSSF